MLHQHVAELLLKDPSAAPTWRAIFMSWQAADLGHYFNQSLHILQDGALELLETQGGYTGMPGLLALVLKEAGCGWVHI